jgi:hypothetical protein
MLAGRSRSSKPQEFLSPPCVFRGALLTTRPGPPKRTPFASGSQLTLFGGKGFNGQSAPMRRAMIAMPQRIPRRFFSRSAPNLSFTDRAWRNSGALRRSAQPLTRPSARKVTQRRPSSLPDDNHPSRYTWISVLISQPSGKIYPTASACEPPHIVLHAEPSDDSGMVYPESNMPAMAKKQLGSTGDSDPQRSPKTGQR